MNGDRIAIVGAGWAGLAAAITLVQAGRSVTLFEAAPEPGGRARSLDWQGLPLDNGQHLLIGAYHQTLELLRIIGVDPDTAFRREPLALTLRGTAGQPDLRLRAPHLPAPWHLLVALLRVRGLDRRDRLRALRFGISWNRARWPAEQDISVERWLIAQGQSPRLREALWHPLCLAVMNTPPAKASARVFAQVLRDAFTHRRSDADPLIPRRPLGEVLPQPALAWLRARGTDCVHRRVTAVAIEPDGRFRLQGRGVADGPFDDVVLATGHHAWRDLLPKHPQLEAFRARHAAFPSEPVCTVYLRYPQPVRLDAPMVGLLSAPGQWIFDRRTTGNPGIVAVVISGPGPHMQQSRESLLQAVTTQLARHYPTWPAPDEGFVVREKRATFHCGVGIDAHRPGNATPLPGLWLAGDFTATSYPATLEGAVRSGVQCAQAILQSSTS